jgi:hypothetical protein
MQTTLPRCLAGIQRTSTTSHSRQYLDGRTLTAMAAIIVLAILVLIGVVVALGRTADTRDADYSLGKVIAPQAASGARSR